ncbi:MAG: phosphohydrolase, partial [Bacteroidota bacterium]
RRLTQKGVNVQATPQFSFFLERDINRQDFLEDPNIIDVFSILDDTDIWASIKYWLNHEDPVLQLLSSMLLERRLFKIRLANEKINRSDVVELREKVSSSYGLTMNESKHFVGQGDVSNSAYIAEGKTIKVLTKKGDLIDVAKATDLPNIKAMSKIVKKHYLCWPKNITL